jgi:hypothetical protein
MKTIIKKYTKIWKQPPRMSLNFIPPISMSILVVPSTADGWIAKTDSSSDSHPHFFSHVSAAPSNSSCKTARNGLFQPAAAHFPCFSLLSSAYFHASTARSACALRDLLESVKHAFLYSCQRHTKKGIYCSFIWMVHRCHFVICSACLLQETFKFMRTQIIYNGPVISYLIYNSLDWPSQINLNLYRLKFDPHRLD